MTCFQKTAIALIAYLCSVQSSCTDLTPYVVAASVQDLKTLVAGGVVSGAAPVFFDLPAAFVTGETVYCLNNLRIPDQVDSNVCTASQQCWLAVGVHATFSSTNTEDRATAVQSCATSEGDVTPCYDCLCSGVSSNVLSSQQTPSDTCGIASSQQWGVTCHDLARSHLTLNESITSDVSTAYVSICPEIGLQCEMCQGGYHPELKIGIQWVSDVQEQCYDNPFGDIQCSIGISAPSIIGVTVGSALLVSVAVYVTYFHVILPRRQTSAREKDSSDKQDLNVVEDISRGTDSIEQEKH